MSKCEGDCTLALWRPAGDVGLGAAVAEGLTGRWDPSAAVQGPVLLGSDSPRLSTVRSPAVNPARQRPSYIRCGIRVSSVPANRHSCAACRTSGSRSSPSGSPATSAIRSARPSARLRRSVTVAACSSWAGLRHLVKCRAVPDELGDDDTVRPRPGPMTLQIITVVIVETTDRSAAVAVALAVVSEALRCPAASPSR